MSEKINYLVVLDDGREIPIEFEPKSMRFGVDYVEIAIKAFDEYNRELRAIQATGLATVSPITTSPVSPQEIDVTIYKLSIKKGKLERDSGKRVSVMPRQRQLTADEFDMKMEEVLDCCLPEEFQAFVRSQAHSQGHSAGMSEVLMIADEIATALSKAFSDYRKRTGIKD